ncbi:MAG TPA: MBL fold metallo-hydrolase [Dongiaceae bacterium]|jgi:phosphoribosyl 1,2-cyclic phosphate phosphodiesterase
MRVTVLGCGGSGGVPLIGGIWGSCNPANPRNRRRRVSIHAEGSGQSILIDASPDMRQQLLDAEIKHLDAVLFTHDHADHCHGIDDLRFVRPDSKAAPLEAWATPKTLSQLKERFGYIFRQNEVGSGVLYRPFLAARLVEGPFNIGAIRVTPFDQQHGLGNITTGYRMGRMAYSTDVVALDEAAFEVLADLDLWIVDCLRFEPHPTHAHFDLTMSWIERLKPKRALLTHLNHMIDYDVLAQRCPPGVEPAYDGLSVEIPD